MSLLKLLSLSRPSVIPAVSVFLPTLRIGVRCFSRSSSLARPPMTNEVPKVSNTAEINNSKSETWLKSSEATMKEIAQRPILDSYSGRAVNSSRGVGESMKILDGILSRNKVRFQLRMAARHEKKGYKRRRLTSERWRNQFASEVRKKVQLVMKMRDRGA